MLGKHIFYLIMKYIRVEYGKRQQIMTNIFSKNKTLYFVAGIAIAIFLMLFLIPTGQSASAYSGNAPIFESINIVNESVSYVNSNTAIVSWETEKPATSRVMYGTESKRTLMFGFDANRMNHGYDFSTNQDNTLTTKHSMIITGLTPNTEYFFRVESRVNNHARIGSELPTDMPNVATSCNYLNSYMKMGFNNDSSEVLKLQTFLRDFEGFTNIELTGIFDQATFDAVSAFQAKYADDVLAPWGITSPTGFVYLTTQKKINEIHCGKTLPLTESQIAEINSFRASIGENQEDNDWYKQIDLDALDKGALKTENILPTINNSEKDEEAYEQDSMQAAVGETKTGWVRSIFNKFKNLFK